MSAELLREMRKPISKARYEHAAGIPVEFHYVTVAENFTVLRDDPEPRELALASASNTGL